MNCTRVAPTSDRFLGQSSYESLGHKESGGGIPIVSVHEDPYRLHNSHITMLKEHLSEQQKARHLSSGQAKRQMSLRESVQWLMSNTCAP